MNRLNASFRDPSGFVFSYQGVIFRQVNASYAQHYDQLMSSGLYEALVKKGWLIPHEEVAATEVEGSERAYKLLRPEPIPYISYP